MTKAMALAFAPQVRVNCVCPGYVDTDMVRRDGIDSAADPAAAEQALLDYTPRGHSLPSSRRHQIRHRRHPANRRRHHRRALDSPGDIS